MKLLFDDNKFDVVSDCFFMLFLLFVVGLVVVVNVVVLVVQLMEYVCLIIVDEIDQFGVMQGMWIVVFFQQIFVSVWVLDVDQFGDKFNELIVIVKGFDLCGVDKGGLFMQVMWLFCLIKEKLLL